MEAGRVAYHLIKFKRRARPLFNRNRRLNSVSSGPRAKNLAIARTESCYQIKYVTKSKKHVQRKNECECTQSDDERCSQPRFVGVGWRAAFSLARQHRTRAASRQRLARINNLNRTSPICKECLLLFGAFLRYANFRATLRPPSILIYYCPRASEIVAC